MTSRSLPLFFAATGLIFFAATAGAHPMPDLPVRTYFDTNGSAVVQLEIDVRTFSADPLNEPYLRHDVLKEFNEKERAELVEKARKLARERLEFYLTPAGRIEPAFDFQFTAPDNQPLVNDDDSVMLTGTWKIDLPKDASGYQVKSTEGGIFSVLFFNHVGGMPVSRFQVLFPGEISYALNLTNLEEQAAKLKKSQASVKRS